MLNIVKTLQIKKKQHSMSLNFAQDGNFNLSLFNCYFLRSFGFWFYLTYQGGAGERQEQLLGRSVSLPLGGTPLTCPGLAGTPDLTCASFLDAVLRPIMLHVHTLLDTPNWTIYYCTCLSCNTHKPPLPRGLVWLYCCLVSCALHHFD